MSTKYTRGNATVYLRVMDEDGKMLAGELKQEIRFVSADILCSSF